MQWKIKQKTAKHEAETCCLNNSNKITVWISLLIDIKFRDFNFRASYISRVLNFAIFSKSRKSLNLVLAKFSENKVLLALPKWPQVLTYISQLASCLEKKLCNAWSDVSVLKSRYKSTWVASCPKSALCTYDLYQEKMRGQRGTQRALATIYKFLKSYLQVGSGTEVYIPL